MEGSSTVEGEQGYWLNLRSRGRALLMLFLFSDTGPDDAPTRIKVGSHLDVPPFLVAAGDRGMSFGAACAAMGAAGKLDSPDRGLALATGHPADVYLCHPFLIHAAQAHRGQEPRFMAQPPLIPLAPLELRRYDGAYSPVELAVLRGLDSPYARGRLPNPPAGRRSLHARLGARDRYLEARPRGPATATTAR
jgi:hypothetical protein